MLANTINSLEVLMKKPAMTFAAAGDMLVQRLVPMETPGFAEIAR